MAGTIFIGLFRDLLEDDNTIKLLFPEETIETFNEGRKKIKSRDPHEKNEAEIQLIKAAEEGMGEAQSLLRSIYLRRSEVQKADQYGELANLYEQAHGADAEDQLLIRSDIAFAAAAQYELGLRYLHGNGIKQNINRAAIYFTAAARTGNLLAIEQLINIYRNDLLLIGSDERKQTIIHRWTLIRKLLTGTHDDLELDVQYKIALAYYTQDDEYSEYCIQNLNLAFKLFLSAATQGHIKAQQKIAQMYQMGRGIKQDLNLAKNWNWLFEIHKSAKRGDLMSQHDIANKVYLSGFKHNGITYIAKDEAKAYKYILLAARNGYLLAQQQLAEMYEIGQGVEQNSDKAAKWDYLAELQEATLSPLSCKPSTMFQLGLEYMQEGICGRYLKYNLNKALDCFLLAAQQNHLPSQEKAAMVYQQYADQETDEQQKRIYSFKALRHFLLAAKQGSLFSQKRVIVIYEQLASQETIEENKKKYVTEANVWRDLLILEQFGISGNPDAQYVLGVIYSGEKVAGGIYEYSLYINKNEAKALSWFDRAATLGNALAKTKVEELFVAMYNKKFPPKYRVNQAGDRVQVADEHQNEADRARVLSTEAYKKIATCYPGS